MRQLQLHKIWSENAEVDSDDDAEIGPYTGFKNGEIQLLWTRVVDSSDQSVQDHSLFSFNKDLKQNTSLRDIYNHLQKKEMPFYFDPDQLKKQGVQLEKDYNMLDENQLKMYAIQATQIRSQFLIKAQNQIESVNSTCQGDIEDKAIDLKIPKRDHSLKSIVPEQLILISKKEGWTSNIPRKRHKRCDLTTYELRKIIDDIQNTNQSYQEIALKYKVQKSLVTKLIYEFRKNPDQFERREHKELQIKHRSKLICDAVDHFINNGSDIWKVQEIQKHVENESKVTVSRSLVTQVLKQNYNMKYRKIKKIPFQGNSDRCLVQRQKYGIAMLELLSQGYRVINIDETWIPYSDYRSFKWRVKGTRNSQPTKPIAHRVNMIAALDTDGKVFYSLTQSNTNTDVVMMFISKLATLLYQKTPKWRENTILQLDGASYHKSQETRNLLKQLQIKVVLSAPYSYDAAPCELLFSHLKRGNWNPTGVNTGKREVFQMVQDRVAQIPESTRIKFWHNTTLSLFRYLTFENL